MPIVSKEEKLAANIGASRRSGDYEGNYPLSSSKQQVSETSKNDDERITKTSQKKLEHRSSSDCMPW